MCRRGQRGDWQHINPPLSCTLSAMCICEWQALCTVRERLTKVSVCRRCAPLHHLYPIAEHHEVCNGGGNVCLETQQSCILTYSLSPLAHICLVLPSDPPSPTHTHAPLLFPKLLIAVFHKPIVNHHSEHFSWHLKESRQDGPKMHVRHFWVCMNVKWKHMKFNSAECARLWLCSLPPSLLLSLLFPRHTPWEDPADTI